MLIILSSNCLFLYGQTIQNWRAEATDNIWQTNGNWWKGTAGPIEFGQQEWNNNHQLNQTNNADISTYRFILKSGASSIHTFSGNKIRFYDFSGNDPMIQNESAALHVINNNLEGDGDGTDPLVFSIIGTQGLTLGGTVNNMGSNINVVGTTASAVNVTFNGVISGAGGFYKENSNLRAQFTVSNTYTGTTTIQNGQLILATNGSIPNSDVRLHTGGILTVNSNASVSSVGRFGVGNEGTISIASGRTLTISGANEGDLIQNSISGAGSLRMSGTGTTAITLTGTQSYTGTTTVTSGKITTNVVMSTGGITISGGEFVTQIANAIPNGAQLNLGNGQYSTGNTVGYTDVLGLIRVTGANAKIKLGTGAHSLTFSASNTQNWGTSTLTILGWTGTPGVSGTAGKIFIGTNESGLTANQLNQIQFEGYERGQAMFLSNGEIVPRPYYYRTIASGDLSNVAIWEISGNNTTWTAATVAPSNASSIITIRNGHTVAVAANVSLDQVTIDAGGQLTVNSGISLTITDGIGTDLQVNGTIQVSGTVVSSSAQIEIGDGGFWTHAAGTSTIPNCTWATNSTLNVIGTSSPNGLGQNFYNFIWNTTGGGGKDLTPFTTLNIQSGGKMSVLLGTLILVSNLNVATRTVTWGGDLLIDGGNFIVTSHTTASFDPTVVFNVNKVTLNSGNLRILLPNGLAGATPDVTMNVADDFVFAGGVLDFMLNGVNSSSIISKLNLSKDFVWSGGEIRRSNGNALPITQLNFVGSSGIQKITQTLGETSYSMDASKIEWIETGASQLDIEYIGNSGNAIPIITTSGNIELNNTGVCTYTNALGLSSGKTLTIAQTAKLDMGFNTINFNNGVTTVHGELICRGGILNSSVDRLIVSSSGTYRHAVETLSTQIPFATWQSGSLCIVSGYTTALAMSGLNGQSFHHFTWDCQNQANDIIWTGTPVFTVNGNLTFKNSVNRYVNFSTSGAPVITVFGNFIMDGGNLDMGVSSGALTIDLHGNLVLNSGALRETGTGTPAIRFVKSSGIQTMERTSTVQIGALHYIIGNGISANTVELMNSFGLSEFFAVTVKNNAKIKMKEFEFSGFGTFTLESGGTLMTSHTSGLNGSITTSNKTFDPAANYVFEGSAIQSTGGLLQTANNVTIDNPSNVNLSVNTTINGLLTFENGSLRTASQLILNNPPSGFNSSQFVHIINSGSLRINSVSSATIFPVGLGANYCPVTISANAPINYTVSLSQTAPCEVANSNKIVNAFWTIQGTMVPSSLTFQWGSSLHASQFSPAQDVKFGRASCPNWSEVNAGTVTGSNPYSITVTSGFMHGTTTYGIGNVGGIMNSLGIQVSVSPSSITHNSAISGGQNITGSGVTAKGVVWNTSPMPTTANFLTNDGSGSANFVSNLTGLSPQTLYYLRSYVTNGSITAYGNAPTFRTLSNPVTQHASNFFGVGDFNVIDLTWETADFPLTGATNKNYVLLRSESPVEPTITNSNGQNVVAGAGTTIVSSTLNDSDLSYENSGLSPGTVYNYKLIPFTWDGTNIDTKNYFISDAPQISVNTKGGWQISVVNNRQTIDFDQTIAGVNEGVFSGTGITSSPTNGQLNSGAWKFDGWSDNSSPTFGMDLTSSDFAGGASIGSVSTSGIYAFEVQSNNKALGFQANDNDFNNGNVTLRFQNVSEETISDLSVGYKLWVRNDQGRANSFNFSHSSDNSSYSSVSDLNFTSGEAADGSPSWLAYQRNVSLTGLNIAPGAFYYLRWSGADAGGSGSRDEFALDDITLVANPTSVFADVKGTIQEFIQVGNTELSADATMSAINLISGTCDVKDKSLTLNTNTISRTTGQMNVTNGTIVLGNTSDLILPQSVFTGAVNNLTLSGSRVQASENLTINGTLNLNAANPDATNGLLDLVSSYGNYANTRTADNTDANNNLNSHVLTLGANATVTGQGDVTGKIRRTSIADGVAYTFGNANMVLQFDQNGGTLPAQITVVATRGDEGLHVDKNGTHNTGPDGLIGGAAVKRMWQVLRTGGTSQVRFTVRFPYTDAELNDNAEANLVTWDHHIPYQGMTPHEHGKTSIDVNANYVELANHGLFYLAEEGDTEFTKYWMLSEKVSADNLWLGAAGGGQGSNWGNPSNWTNGVIPDGSNLINFVVDGDIYANELTLTGSQEANAIEIKPGAVVNGGTGTLTLKGGPADNGGVGTWINNGTFNAGTSTVVFDNDDATIAGSTNFHHVTVNTGKKLTPQANNVMGISGTLTVDGTLDATTNTNEIVYNGSNQTIYQPNGTTPGYSGLGIQQNSGGTVTLGESIQVLDNLNMTEGNINPNGHTLEIGNGVSRTGNVNWIDGTVLGPMKRWFGTAANSTQASGIFPVGLGEENRLAVINFTGTTDGGYIVMEYKTGKPEVRDEFNQILADPFGLPLTYLNEQGLRRYIQNADATGYWDITPYSAAVEAYGALDNNNFDITLRMNSQIIRDNPVTANPPGMRIIRAKGNPSAAHDPFEIGAAAAIISQVQGSTPGTDYLVRSNGLQGFSWFNIGGDNETPLPVELLYFNGQCTEQGNILRWATASEFNSSHYDVEASRDGENWNVVNTIAAAGFSTEKLNYQTVDMAKNEGTLYYRLRQVDINGDERLYNPIAVSCGENGNILTTYPNPSNESFTLLVSDESMVGQAVLTIRDINGRLVSSNSITILSGSNSYEIKETLPSGMYFIQVENGMKVSSVLRQSVR